LKLLIESIVQNAPSWTAIAAAVFAGLAMVIPERFRFRERAIRRIGLARAADDLAREALQLVSERLEWALKSVDGPTLFELRGHRTTGMVQCMREFDTAALHPDLLESFARVRRKCSR